MREREMRMREEQRMMEEQRMRDEQMRREQRMREEQRMAEVKRMEEERMRREGMERRDSERRQRCMKLPILSIIISIMKHDVFVMDIHQCFPCLSDPKISLFIYQGDERARTVRDGAETPT